MYQVYTSWGGEFIEELDVLRVITRKTSNSSNFPPFLEEGGLGGMVIL
jgi:hypothetical protein